MTKRLLIYEAARPHAVFKIVSILNASNYIFFLLGRWLPRLGPARPGSARRAPTRAMFPLGARNLGVSTGSRRCQASELISIDRISTAPISRNLWGPVSVSLSLLLFRAEAGSKIPLLDAPTRCINSKKVRRGTVGKLANRCFRQRIRNIIADNFICFKNERFSEPKSRKPRLKFFWLQIGLAPRRCSLPTPLVFTLPSKMMKTSIFFLSRHGLVSRIFLIPMIKKEKGLHFFYFKTK